MLFSGLVDTLTSVLDWWGGMYGIILHSLLKSSVKLFICSYIKDAWLSCYLYICKVQKHFLSFNSPPINYNALCYAESVDCALIIISSVDS